MPPVTTARLLSAPLFRGHRYPLVLLAAFALLWTILAVEPVDRTVWASENALLLIAIPVLVVTSRRFRFSDLSYTLMFGFFLLHAIGAHYTYPRVPFSLEIGSERNNFDRLVHFSFGFLLAVPAREIFRRVAESRGFWSYYFPFELALALSALFEVVEWAVVVVVDAESGISYLGAQGDPFDPVKDVALAGLGASVTMVGMALHEWRKRRRRFEREFEESLRIKQPDPEE